MQISLIVAHVETTAIYPNQLYGKKFIFSVRHHLCDFLASLCDPSKDPIVQYHWQNWALSKTDGSNS